MLKRQHIYPGMYEVVVVLDSGLDQYANGLPQSSKSSASIVRPLDLVIGCFGIRTADTANLLPIGVSYDNRFKLHSSHR
jgi:hypothetical protein